jgi:hypothetical protein
MSDENKFDLWAVVELFGHQRIAGRVTEQVIAGQGFIRVDVPATGDQIGFTRMFGPGAIYSIIPTMQEIVTAFVRENIGAPIALYTPMLREKLLTQRNLNQKDDDEY